MYLHQHNSWTEFTWDNTAVLPLLRDVSFAQGRLLGIMERVGFNVEAETEVRALADEVVASSRIEGVELDADKVRSSVSQQLGFDELDLGIDTHDVDGAVSVMLDATKHCEIPLSHERLFGWHNALFPTGYSGLHKIRVASYRDQPMSVLSGPIGRERVHFEAPDAGEVTFLMDEFVNWFNDDDSMDYLVKAGLAHLRFLTIHPFDDGNGRISRALSELLLARSDHGSRRFYSMAGYILAHREQYYAALERAQKGGSDVTAWLVWFLNAIEGAVEESVRAVLDVVDRQAFWSALEGVSLNNRQRMVLECLKGDFEGKLTAGKWAKLCKVSSDTALRDINDLIDKGILVRDAAGGRSTAYLLNCL